jgi:starch synthase
MRLLTVTHYFGSHGGGIELVAGRLAAELAAAGHEVSWLASDASPPCPDRRVRMEPIRASHWAERRLGIPFPVPAVRELGKIVRAAAEADAVLIHDCLYPSNIFAFASAKRARKPVLIVQHIGDVPYRNPLLRLAMKLANRLITSTLLARADQVIFISELTARHFADLRFRRPPVLAFNGVDSSVFHLGAATQQSALRRSLGFKKSDKVVVFAGRFVEKKGLQAVHAVAQARPKLTFALAGQGPTDPASWRLPNVRVLGQLSPHDLANLYRAGDLLLLPSTGEGFPLVIQEALACGLRVITGEETAGADSAASAYITGARVDPDDPQGTAANFLAAMDRELRRNSSQEERRRRSKFAIERYSWERLGQVYDALLRNVGNPPAGTRRPTSTLAKLIRY